MSLPLTHKVRQHERLLGFTLVHLDLSVSHSVSEVTAVSEFIICIQRCQLGMVQCVCDSPGTLQVHTVTLQTQLLSNNPDASGFD